MEELKALKASRLTLSLLNLSVQEATTSQDSEDAVVPEVVLTFEFGLALPHFRRAMDRLEDMIAGAAGGVFQDDSIAGRKVRHLPIPFGKGFGIWHTLHDDVLIVTTSRAAMAGVLARLETRDKKDTLAGNATYREIEKHIVRDGTLLRAYGDVKRILGVLFAQMPEATRDAFSLWGFNAYQAIGYGLDFDGVGIRDRIYTRLVDDHGWPTGRHLGETRIRTHEIVPAETGVYAAGLLDFEQMYDALLKTLDNGYPRLAEEMRSGAAQVDINLGFNLRDDLLGTLGPEYCVFMAWPGKAVLPDIGLMLQVRENARPKIEGIIDTVRDEVQDKIEIRETVFRGTKIQWLDFTRLAGADRAKTFGPHNLKPTFAFVDEYFVVTLWPQAMKNLIAGLENKTPRLKDRPDFVRLRSKISPQGDEASLFYVDIEGAVGFVMDNGVPFLQSLVPSDPSVPLDVGAFPTTDCVTKHLFGMMGVSRWSGEHAVYSEMYSPTGAVTSYVVVSGVIVATLVMSVLQEAAVEPGFGGQATTFEAQKRDLAATQIAMLSVHVNAFQDWEGSLPATKQWPKFLTDGSPNHPDAYLTRMPTDPWGRAYVYRLFPNGRFLVLSYGADGEPGGEGENADIDSSSKK